MEVCKWGHLFHAVAGRNAPMQRERVKFWGPPGTGKTNRLIGIVNDELDHDVRPEEIIYTSFTRAACSEAISRALQTSEMNYKRDNFPWFRTEHAICFKLLGLDKAHVFTGKSMQEFSDLYPAYKFTANHGYSFQIRTHETMLQSLGDYYEFFLSWMDNMAMPFSEAIKQFVRNQHGDLPSEFTVSGAQTYMERREAFKQEKSLWDFSDMIHSVTQRHLYPDMKVLIQDEAQDSSRLLWNLINMWADQAERVYIAGDPYQCVPEGTKIAAPGGDIPIEQLKKGDRVLSSVGSGHAGIGVITNIHGGDSSDSRITILTKSGKRLKLTSKHQLFSLMPLFKAAPTRKAGCFYVYLMYKAEIGWRIGLTNQPASRILGEGCAPFMHIIAAFDTWEEGIYQEELWSLKYGIPTQTFIAHNKHQFIVGELLKKMCDELGVADRVKKLADDLGIDLRFPIHIPQSTTLRNPVRVVVNIRMATLKDHHVSRKSVSEYAGWHFLTVETSDPEWGQKLKDMGFTLTKGRVLRVWSKDLAYIMSIAEKLAQMGALVKIGHVAKGSTQPGILTVAGNIMRGYKVPILEGEDIIWDEVVDVKREFGFGKVYDLDIGSYHNYIAEGIMVHNSIFGFAGAAPELFERFKGELEVLPHSHRLTPQVKDYAEKIISLANLPFPKFSAADRVGEITSGQLNTIDWVNLGPTFLLARTRWQLKELSERLKLMGVPFAMAERLHYEGPLESSKGEAFRTLIKIQAREKISTDELRALAKHTRQPWLVKGAKTRIKDLVQSEYTFKDVSHFFSQNFLDVINEDFSSVLCQDIDEGDKSYLHRVYKKCGVSAFTKKPEITLSTIHGVKGLQRETVVISPDLGHRVYESFLTDKKSEVFVAYVAVTRAQKRIIMLPRETPESFPYPRTR